VVTFCAAVNRWKETLRIQPLFWKRESTSGARAQTVVMVVMAMGRNLEATA